MVAVDATTAACRGKITSPPPASEGASLQVLRTDATSAVDILSPPGTDDCYEGVSFAVTLLLFVAAPPVSCWNDDDWLTFFPAFGFFPSS